jgi:hypothetical protein
MCVAGRAYYSGTGGGRSQIIRPRESLVLYKSYNALWGEERHVDAELMLDFSGRPLCHIHSYIPKTTSFLPESIKYIRAKHSRGRTI